MQQRLASLVAEMHQGGILYSEALDVFRKAFISAALRENNGNLSKTARALGLHRNTLTRLCFELEIDAKSFRAAAPPARQGRFPNDLAFNCLGSSYLAALSTPIRSHFGGVRKGRYPAMQNTSE